MNPLTLTLLFLLINQSGSRETAARTSYLLPSPLNAAADSFQIELLLDRLHSLTDTLEKVNGLAHMSVPSAEIAGASPTSSASDSDSASGLDVVPLIARSIATFSSLLNVISESPFLIRFV